MRKIEIAHLTRERDAARRQFAETKTVNLHNAAAHRASEVAALMSNVAQNAEIERLRVALPGAKPRAIESVEMPAIRVPKLRPLDMAEKIPAQLSAVPQPETKSP